MDHSVSGWVFGFGLVFVGFFSVAVFGFGFFWFCFLGFEFVLFCFNSSLISINKMPLQRRIRYLVGR